MANSPTEHDAEFILDMVPTISVTSPFLTVGDKGAYMYRCGVANWPCVIEALAE